MVAAALALPAAAAAVKAWLTEMQPGARGSLATGGRGPVAEAENIAPAMKGDQIARKGNGDSSGGKRMQTFHNVYLGSLWFSLCELFGIFFINVVNFLIKNVNIFLHQCKSFCIKSCKLFDQK